MRQEDNCKFKVNEKRSSQDLVNFLGLKGALDGLAKASGVLRYGHVLRRDNSNVLRRALNFEVVKRGRGRRKMTRRRQVDQEIGLKKGKYH